MSLILGLNAYHGDASACILRDGVILAAVEEEFSDILKAGRMIQGEALEEEADEKELSGLVRLVFRHRRRDFGRLRQLIDAVNAAEVIEQK